MSRWVSKVFGARDLAVLAKPEKRVKAPA